jgi:hypothetical protein
MTTMTGLPAKLEQESVLVTWLEPSLKLRGTDLELFERALLG